MSRVAPAALRCPQAPVALVLGYEVALSPVAFAPADVNGLWWAMAASAFASFVVGIAWFHRGGWREAVIDEDGTGAVGEAVDGDGIDGEEPVTD